MKLEEGLMGTLGRNWREYFEILDYTYSAFFSSSSCLARISATFLRSSSASWLLSIIIFLSSSICACNQIKETHLEKMAMQHVLRYSLECPYDWIIIFVRLLFQSFLMDSPSSSKIGLWTIHQPTPTDLIHKYLNWFDLMLVHTLRTARSSSLRDFFFFSFRVSKPSSSLSSEDALSAGEWDKNGLNICRYFQRTDSLFNHSPSGFFQQSFFFKDPRHF